MSSKYVKRLMETAQLLREEGYPLSAEMVEQSASRMEAMEKLIVSLKDKVEEIESE